MTSPSELVRSMVMRELEDGVRQDGLWLQALSECKMDPAQAQQRYITLRCEALQGQVKGALIRQIKGAIATDAPADPTPSNGHPQRDLADFLRAKVMGGNKP